MNRQARRARAREFDRARAAILTALGPELAVAYHHNAPAILDELAELVAGGYTTAALGASVLARINDLADATVRGEITTDEGCTLVAVHALAERDGREPD